MYVKYFTLFLGYYHNTMTLGENIKNLRKLNNISQKEFAMKMDTTQQRVSEWECNKIEPSLYNVVKILNVFNISFEELIDGVNW